MPRPYDHDKLGPMIKQCRMQAGLTQAELAFAIGCSEEHLSRIETGRRTISVDNLVRIARLFGLSADDMLRTADPKPIDPYQAAINVRLQNCTEKEKRLFLELLKICKQLTEQA